MITKQKIEYRRIFEIDVYLCSFFIYLFYIFWKYADAEMPMMRFPNGRK